MRSAAKTRSSEHAIGGLHMLVSPTALLLLGTRDAGLHVVQVSRQNNSSGACKAGVKVSHLWGPAFTEVVKGTQMVSAELLPDL